MPLSPRLSFTAPPEPQFANSCGSSSRRRRKLAACRLAACCAIVLPLAPLTSSAAEIAPAASASGRAAEPGEAVAPPVFSDNRIVLKAEQSTGGKLTRDRDGAVTGVILDKSCEPNFPKGADGRIEWKLQSPLPAGWWHGRIETKFRGGYANREMSLVMASGQNPAAAVTQVTRDQEGNQQFDFWIHTSAETASVHIHPSSLWHWISTWPIRQIVLEHAEPKGLTADQTVVLDLPVGPDGAAALPAGMPAGTWSLTAVTKQDGAVWCEGQDGGKVRAPINVDKLKPAQSRTVYFYVASPLCGVASEKPGLFQSVLLKHQAGGPAAPITAPEPLITTVDAAKPESAELLLIGANLSGEAPTFPKLPLGKKVAVLTSWDDGKMDDLRCAEILHKHHYHPSFFLNHDSPAIGFLNELEALGVEIGSHSYSHPSLYAVTPQRAVEECVEMRKILEKALKHPVISFAYPNGYFPAYDVEGDYVVRALEAAGTWSGRTTQTAAETVDSVDNPLTWATDGFFGYAKELEKAWESTRTKDGGIFYFWGHSWQIGKTDEQWQKFEEFVAKFADQPEAWYASQGELSLWMWLRKNVRITVAATDGNKTTLQLRRPWLHPYLSAQCPLTLLLPPGVQKVVWRGKEIPAPADRIVTLPWQN